MPALGRALHLQVTWRRVSRRSGTDEAHLRAWIRGETDVGMDLTRRVYLGDAFWRKQINKQKLYFVGEELLK